MEPRIPSRRNFLKWSALSGLGAAVGVVGCGGDGGQEQAAAGAKAQGAPCTDLGALSPEQIEIRASYDYVERAEDPREACRLCEYWEDPPAGGFCGGCALMAGPIHPEASCASFEEIST